MSKEGKKKLSDILHDNHTQLGQLLYKVFQLKDLEGLLNQYLDDNFVIHTKLGSYQNGKLTLLTDSGSWATKLHYQIPDLLSKLRKHQAWAGLRNIEVKVAPHLCQPRFEETPPAPTQVAGISEQNRALLAQKAEHLGDSQESMQLKQALLKLSRKIPGNSAS